MSLEWAKQGYANFVAFTKSILADGRDFGKVPWISKPSLLKPGAEKLRLFYGLGVEIERTSETMDIEKDFYDVTYKVSVRDKQGVTISECEGSCNTYEDNYHFRREKKPKPTKEVEDKKKSEGVGRNRQFNGQRERQERVENTNKIGKKNTIQKMAQKRAYVWAVLNATGASEFFTQDVEDMWFAAAAVDATPATTSNPQTAQATTTTTSSQPASGGSAWPITDKQLNFLGSILTRHKFDNKDEVLAKMIDKYCPWKTLESLSTKDGSTLIDKAQDKSQIEFDLWMDELPFGADEKPQAPVNDQVKPIETKVDTDEDLPF